MNIEIVGVKEKGNLDKERIVLKALSDLDIGFFIVFLTEKNKEDTFESNPKEVFWFPNKKINKGDLVVLYSKVGKKSEKTNETGNFSHFYYVGLLKPFFDDSSKIAAIIEAEGWGSVQ